MRTHTDKNLENQIGRLEARVNTLQASNSALRDTVVELKSNYERLVEGLNERFSDLIESNKADFEQVRSLFKRTRR